MNEYYKIPILILYHKNLFEKDKKVDRKMEYVIVKKTLYGYKEVVTGLKLFKRKILNTSDYKIISQDSFDTNIVSDKVLEFIKENDIWIGYDNLLESITKVASLSEVKFYLENFSSSNFKKYYDKLDKENDKINKKEKKEIKKLIKDYKNKNY